MMTNESSAGWSAVGQVEFSRLVDPRLQLHWALQPAMAFADSVLEHLPDDCQSNFGWRDDLQALIGRQRPDRLSAALRISDMTLLVLDGSSAVAESLSLAGRTLEVTVSWLDEMIATHTGDRSSPPIRLRDYEMPPHPVADGAAFEVDHPAAFAELGRWFASGNSALRELEPCGEGWAAVRCWPHHFDLGTLANLGSLSKSIGAGLSLGDDSYPEPYFYVNPYGLDETRKDFPALESGGHWHREGWFGAVLTAPAILEGPLELRASAVAAFLRSAVEAAERLLAA